MRCLKDSLRSVAYDFTYRPDSPVVHLRNHLRVGEISLEPLHDATTEATKIIHVAKTHEHNFQEAAPMCSVCIGLF